MGNVEVSVLLITYNADWSKLKMTLESILLQQNVKMELIVADDGSLRRWDEEIAEVCKQYHFVDYKLVTAEQNGGTVKNLYNAALIAQGEYSKAISPGDLLYGSNTLREWVDHVKASHAQLSFGDAVYYNFDQEGKLNIIETKPAPANLEVFDEPQNRNQLFVNYMLANDTILGASIMMRTDAMKQYLKRFVGRVMFAEDYMARLMIFEDQKVHHYSENVVWYEHGLGISTAKNDKWTALLYKDFVASNEVILLESPCPDNIARKYLDFIAKDVKNGALRKIYKCLMFPGVVRWRLKRRNTKNRTSKNVDKSFIETFVSQDLK